MDSLFQFFGYFNTYSSLPPLLKKISFGSSGGSRSINGCLSKSELVEKRKKLIGSKCQTFYEKDPFVVSRAFMQYLYDEKGAQFLDCISNVQHVGHCHPRVVEAIAQQLATSTCNVRFLSSRLTECAEAILKTLPPELDTVLFCNSGSEANDLALQLARDFTGHNDVIVLENAYHGHVTTAIQMSPYKLDHGSSIRQPDWVHVACAPDVYRGKFALADDELGDRLKLVAAGQKYSEEVGQVIEGACEKGRTVAAYITEALQSCGGQVLPPPGYLKDVAMHVRAKGGLIIIDEVQTGFGRVGKTFWAHQLDGPDFVPDILTMGKPIGNGFPVAAVVTRKEIADMHCGGVEYFNTYGGNPVACAAILGVMEVIREERLLEHSERMHQLFEQELKALQKKHDCIGDIRGVGMFWGVDLVKDRKTREPDTDLAGRLVLELRKEHNVLLNADGPHTNVLKFKPPLCFSEEDLHRSIKAIDKVLRQLLN